METKPSFYLAELLTSRLCHDLITPVGAIHTGLELLQETSSDQSTEADEILNLLLHSAQTASARLSFYRVAFGSGGGKTSLENVKELIEKYFVRSKLQIRWIEENQNGFSFDKWGRLLLNSVLWMSDCAPRGGILSITLPKGDPPLLSLRLRTDSIILHQGTLEALEGKALLQDITPRTIPCYLIHSIVKDDHKNLTVNKTSSPSELTLEIT